MDYPQKSEEFYELMKRKKEEIKSLDLSENEKNNFYKLVDETVQRFENLKSYNLSGKILALNESFGNLGGGIGKLVNLNSKIKKEVIKSEEAIFKFRIIKAFDSQSPLNN